MFSANPNTPADTCTTTECHSSNSLLGSNP